MVVYWLKNNTIQLYFISGRATLCWNFSSLRRIPLIYSQILRVHMVHTCCWKICEYWNYQLVQNNSVKLDKIFQRILFQAVGLVVKWEWKSVKVGTFWEGRRRIKSKQTFWLSHNKLHCCLALSVFFYFFWSRWESSYTFTRRLWN